MVRTQIQLEDEQYKALKRWAAERGISLAEAVRRSVAAMLASEATAQGREALVREARAVIGKYAEKQRRSRVARDHDRYLSAIYER